MTHKHQAAEENLFAPALRKRVPEAGLVTLDGRRGVNPLLLQTPDTAKSEPAVPHWPQADSNSTAAGLSFQGTTTAPFVGDSAATEVTHHSVRGSPPSPLSTTIHSPSGGAPVRLVPRPRTAGSQEPRHISSHSDLAERQVAEGEISSETVLKSCSSSGRLHSSTRPVPLLNSFCLPVFF
ncbi:unnamed protein product [Pleuronectes platessa]|uniref:Uncharacterized protein n=1 Tax=Pleuronectes platessa TaxID=8262 RepID=A0A9N7YB61_PLEPL|nr:unnamed protein product [Pleuronectes platessa]